MPLKAFAGFALDMDGTFYIGDQLLPGALDFIHHLRREGIPYRFLTNNTSRSSQDYVEKLVRLGLADEDALVYTAGDACIAYLKEAHPGKRVFLLGTPSLARSFEDGGILLDDAEPELAVLAYDTTLTYARLTRFCDLVRAGLPYIATHPDLNCPVPGGYAPDAGSMMALVQASASRQPDLIVGKPNPEILRQLAHLMGVSLDQLVMVGDRLYTDMALGQAAGAQTVLVLSGETDRATLNASEIKPNLVCQDLADLLTLLQA